MPETSVPRPLPRSPQTSAAVCPFLLSADGGWRASTPAPHHRCTAVRPVSRLATDKQRRLCLAEGFTTCATYGAAMSRPAHDGDGTGPAARDVPPAARAQIGRPSARTIVRTAPLVLDHGRPAIPTALVLGDRGLGQTALVLLMIVAFAAIVIARISSPSGGATGLDGQVGAVTGTPVPSVQAS